MKPQELRIGNWIEYDNRYFQIGIICQDLPFLDTAEFGVGVVDYNNIKPIELTNQILINCGFKKRPEYFYGIKINKKAWLEVNKSDRRTILFEDNNYTELINVKHLHELQNLYYSLTKQELTVKL